LIPLWSQLGIRFNPNSGRNDWVWEQGQELKVPHGTVVSFRETLDTYTVHLERKSDFYLDLNIKPGSFNHGLRTLPMNFKPSRLEFIQDAYCYFVTVNMDFRWQGKSRYSSQSYADWAEGLFTGLQKHLVSKAGDN
jgi:hypothetical protein